jgi:uncharacterized protein (DUF2062 family)
MPELPRIREIPERRIVSPLLALLRQGVTPDKLALSLALGMSIGLVPVLGVSTALCAVVALGLRLNMPAIQLVNYLLTPLQLLAVIPFLRFGEWIAQAPRSPITLEAGLTLQSQGAIHAVTVLATAIIHATLGWIVLAPVAAFALYQALHPILRRLAPSPLQDAR